MTHAPINFSLSPHLGVWGVLLGLRGKGMVSFIVFAVDRLLLVLKNKHEITKLSKSTAEPSSF